MKKLFFTAAIILSSCLSFSQNYNDVAVIVNDSSLTSVSIGSYFQTARNIPAGNMIHIGCSTQEVIDSIEMSSIRGQIESYLITNNLVDSINYIVTTKGVPLKVGSGCVLDTIPTATCASVDTELALMLGPLSSEIGQSNGVFNPYFNLNENFDRDSLGIYLVMRLDGYTEQYVMDLIDRSGPMTGLNDVSAQTVIDINATGAADSNYFDNLMQPAYNFLQNDSWNVTFETTSDLTINEQNVFGYANIGYGSFVFPVLNFDWTEGSFGTIIMCNSAETFEWNQTISHLLVADAIAEGATAMHGYVNCFYTSQALRTGTLFSSYLSDTVNYNLAESYYLSEPYLSWQSVFIGDPKATVFKDSLANLIENEVPFGFTIYPNPASSSINIERDRILEIDISDALGKNIHMQILPEGKDEVSINVSSWKRGVYLVRVRSQQGNSIQRLVIK